MVGDFLDVLRQLADDFGSFLEEASDVAHVAHWYRGGCLAALDIARARTARQDEALMVLHVVPHGSSSLGVRSHARRCPDGALQLIHDQMSLREGGFHRSTGVLQESFLGDQSEVVQVGKRSMTCFASAPALASTSGLKKTPRPA